MVKAVGQTPSVIMVRRKGERR